MSSCSSVLKRLICCVIKKSNKEEDKEEEKEEEEEPISDLHTTTSTSPRPEPLASSAAEDKEEGEEDTTTSTSPRSKPTEEEGVATSSAAEDKEEEKEKEENTTSTSQRSESTEEESVATSSAVEDKEEDKPTYEDVVIKDTIRRVEMAFGMTEFNYGDCPKHAVEFVVKDGYTVIGWAAFDSCSSLKTIQIPKSIKRINTWAFRDCSLLQKIVLPPSLMILGESAFKNCASLEEIIIQGPIPLIPKETFKNCYRLKSVVLPESIQSIEMDAFTNCASLVKIRLPKSVIYIHAYAFKGCLLLQFDNCSVIDSIIQNGGVDPLYAPKQNPFHKDKYRMYKCPSIEFKQGPGATNGFGGVTQKGYGPEMCGISLEQLMVLKQHPLYHRTGKDGKSDYLMRDFVRLLQLITAGTGMGYSLLINKENPLKVKVMVSHACETITFTLSGMSLSKISWRLLKLLGKQVHSGYVPWRYIRMMMNQKE